MSNCIQFREGVVLFRNSEFDVQAFKEFMAKPEVTENYKDDKWGSPPSYGSPGYDWKINIAWWFVHGTWREDGDGKGIWITFGDGRSSHTWRDFKGVIIFLRQFVLLPKNKIFYIADEMDDFKYYERVEVDFWTPKVGSTQLQLPDQVK